MSVAFDLMDPLPAGRMLVEASAGTGKTYSIAALVARFVAGELAGPPPAHDLTEGIGVDEILVVTYTRAAASELRDRIRGKLRLAADYLDGAPLAATDAWLQVFDTGTPRARLRRSARLRDALARFDEATITTIHGFCQQALAQYGLRAGTGGAVELIENGTAVIAEVCRDVLLQRLAEVPLALSTDQHDRPPAGAASTANGPVAARQLRSPADVERYLVSTVRAVITNPGARCEPSPSSGGVAGAWAEAVETAVAEVSNRQRARHQIGYDRLVSDLSDLLADPDQGPQLAEQLAGRYRLVLVDEFQDTDRLQWAIFDRAFARHRLITVGDPKQAIYRFRGADVHAYLAARTSAPATMRTNYRSDRQLLDALALLFDGARLGHPDIEFTRVDAGPTAPHNALGAGTAAVHLRVVPDDPAIPHTKQGLEAGSVGGIILTDVASRVRTLLDSATIRVGRTSRRVRPSDIGILVPSQRRAAETATVLRDWAIPTVRARTGSVLHTAAAMQWRLLLAGLAAPTRATVARGAGLSWFFGLEPAALVDVDATDPPAGSDSPLAELQRLLAVLAERLRWSGVGALCEHLRAEHALLPEVLSRPNGERDLTDLDHIGELLVTAVGGGPCEPSRVEEALETLIADADDQSETAMRRIETDADAVHITTVHSAKGLEYPIVLVPFAYTERPPLSRPYVYNVDGRRVVDIASWVAWGHGADEGSAQAAAALTKRRELARNELDGDAMRLLYVSFTRAKHRLEVWWAPTRGAPTSALGRVLLDRWGAGPVFNSAPGDAFERCGADAASAQIDEIVRASNGTMARFDLPLDQPIRNPLPLSAPPARLLTVADGGYRHPLHDPSWRSWSFTSISASLDHEPSPHVVMRPESGGMDEPADPVDGQIPLPPTVVRSAASAMPLADAPGGTTFGTAVHEVLERVDFTSPTLTADVVSLVAEASRGSGLALDVDGVAAGLVAAIDTPLGAQFEGKSLRQLSPGDRLAELTFDLSLAGSRVPAGRIGDVLTATLDAGDPLRSYGGQLAGDLGDLEITGWLTGSIDGVYRVGSARAERFVVVDYKSNRLHTPGDADPLAAYRPDRLVAAMTHSHYPLQALLYSVALHRYLMWRLGPTYAPERHLGGISYLFVRGMVGPATPVFDGVAHGVFAWTPPAATVLAIDDLLRHGGAT